MSEQSGYENHFPLVCVGGSAGGFEAYRTLLKTLTKDTGAAIVIVNHIRSFETQLHKTLSYYTSMPVALISENLTIEPNHVYVIPSNRDLHVSGGKFHLMPISKPYGWPDVITVFLKSLAENWSGKLVAVIVSGMDGDGADALCKIRDAGGLTIAQKPSTASQNSMPMSAIESGCIDMILDPEEIAEMIGEITRSSSGR